LDLMTSRARRCAGPAAPRRGTARLEIGAGALTGATLVVHADDGRVRVQIDVPPGVDASAWQARIRRGLADCSIEAEAIEVT
jgi:hypothetical protein